MEERPHGPRGGRLAPLGRTRDPTIARRRVEVTRRPLTPRRTSRYGARPCSDRGLVVPVSRASTERRRESEEGAATGARRRDVRDGSRRPWPAGTGGEGRAHPWHSGGGARPVDVPRAPRGCRRHGDRLREHLGRRAHSRRPLLLPEPVATRWKRDRRVLPARRLGAGDGRAGSLSALAPPVAGDRHRALPRQRAGGPPRQHRAPRRRHARRVRVRPRVAPHRAGVRASARGDHRGIGGGAVRRASDPHRGRRLDLQPLGDPGDDLCARRARRALALGGAATPARVVGRVGALHGRALLPRERGITARARDPAARAHAPRARARAPPLRAGPPAAAPVSDLPAAAPGGARGGAALEPAAARRECGGHRRRGPRRVHRRQPGGVRPHGHLAASPAGVVRGLRRRRRGARGAAARRPRGTRGRRGPPRAGCRARHRLLLPGARAVDAALHRSRRRDRRRRARALPPRAARIVRYRDRGGLRRGVPVSRAAPSRRHVPVL